MSEHFIKSHWEPSGARVGPGVLVSPYKLTSYLRNTPLPCPAFHWTCFYSQNSLSRHEHLLRLLSLHLCLSDWNNVLTWLLSFARTVGSVWRSWQSLPVWEGGCQTFRYGFVIYDLTSPENCNFHFIFKTMTAQAWVADKSSEKLFPSCLIPKPITCFLCVCLQRDHWRP